MVSIHITNPLAFSVGLLGNFLSFLVTLAPLATFYKVHKKKSIGSFQSTPYVIALSSALLWFYYALLTRNVLLLTINTSTCVLESVYLFIYLFYATKKDRVSTVKMMLLFDASLFGIVLLLTLVFFNGKKRIEITGWICACFAVCVFVAPLSIIRLIIRTKSVEYMPFTLSLFLTLSAIAWFFYGLLLKDFFVALPNILGFLFGVSQIILYVIYMNAKVDRNEQQNANSQATEEVTTKSSNLDPEVAHHFIHESTAIGLAVPVEIKVEV